MIPKPTRSSAALRRGTWFVVLATSALVVGGAGCTAREFGPERQRAREVRRDEVRAEGAADPRAAHIGAFGYQSDGLIHGETGDGRFLSAGLPARGGGPVADQDCEPRALAPGEHIGTPQNDGVERVVVDPVNETPVVYSQRRQGVAQQFRACGLPGTAQR